MHNLYGILTQKATFDGLVKRDPRVRPFLLSRSFYLGSQRYGAIWTGDNSAGWDHLAASVSMTVSLSMGGQSFVGADVGGYKNNPTEELMVRWFQFGAFYPFFRGHSDMFSIRREPWKFSADTRDRIRSAILLRYRLLPHVYTLFYEFSKYGIPMLRPMWYRYKNVPDSTEDRQLMLGPDLLVIPALDSGSAIKGYLPPDSLWYSIYSNRLQQATGMVDLGANMNEIGAFVKGGAIIPQFARLRRSSKIMRLADPYTLVVFPDRAGKAEGFLYLDDGESWDYASGTYLLKQLTYHRREVTVRNLHKGFDCGNRIEKIIIAGPIGASVKKVLITEIGGNRAAEEAPFAIKGEGLEIRTPHMSVAKEYSIKLQ